MNFNNIVTKDSDKICPECGSKLRECRDVTYCPKCYPEKIRKEIEQETDQELKQASLNRKNQKINNLLKDSNIPKKFYKTTFETFNTNVEGWTAKEKQTATNVFKGCLNYAKTFKQRKADNDWVFISGLHKVGTGKSHLISAIGNELLKKYYKVVFFSEPNFLETLKSKFGDNDDKQHNFINRITDVDFFILDDLGKKVLTEWAREQMFLLINTLYMKETPTGITSELIYPEIKKKYGEWISRFFGRSQKYIYGLELQNYRERSLWK